MVNVHISKFNNKLQPLMDFMKVATLFPVSHLCCCNLCIINTLNTWGQLSLFVGMYHN